MVSRTTTTKVGVMFLFFSDQVIRNSNLNLKAAFIGIQYYSDVNPLVSAISDLVVQDDDAIEKLRQLSEVQSNPKTTKTRKMSVNDFKRMLCVYPKALLPKAILGYVFNALKKTAEGRNLLGSLPNKFQLSYFLMKIFHHESYNDVTVTDESFISRERWVTQILALFFERRIEIISIFDVQDRQVHQEHYDKCWYIFGIRAGKESVYLSTSPSKD